MQVLIPTESRYVIDSAGTCWAHGEPGYDFWARYLSVYESVQVLARLKEVDSPPQGGTRVDGPGVGVQALPYFVGPAGYLMSRRSYARRVRSAVATSEAVLLRVPGQAGTLARRFLGDRPCGVEVVGDPYAVFSPGANTHPARALFRWHLTRNLRKVVRDAAVVAYVSPMVLPERYPARSAQLVTHYSSIELTGAAFVDGPRERGVGPLRAVTVGSLEQPYKGVDTLLTALGYCAERGVEVHLTVVGDGRYKSSLERLADRLRIAHAVTFTGRLPAESVRGRLDAADVFVLASRTEGLPRAMIEAMARGLPCAGTNVGGIPELLSPAEMVPPDDPAALARLLLELGSQHDRYRRLSETNLSIAAQYRDDVLKSRRDGLYQALRNATAPAR